MFFKLYSGTEVSLTLTKDTGRVVADARGVPHKVMIASANAVLPHRSFGEIKVYKDMQVGFPMDAPECVPFVTSDLLARITGALNRRGPEYPFSERSIFTLCDVKTISIGTDTTKVRHNDPLISLLLGRGSRPATEFIRGFSAPPIADVLARWKKEGYSTLSRNPDGIRVRLTSDSTLYFHGTGTTFTGNIANRHLAARGAVEYLRDRSDGVITIGNGTESYMMSLWAHAQLLRLVVSDYEPRRAMVATHPRSTQLPRPAR